MEGIGWGVDKAYNIKFESTDLAGREGDRFIALDDHYVLTEAHDRNGGSAWESNPQRDARNL